MKHIEQLLVLDPKNANYYFLKGTVMERQNKVIFYFKLNFLAR